jgi:hypothetical protein
MNSSLMRDEAFPSTTIFRNLRTPKPSGKATEENDPVYLITATVIISWCRKIVTARTFWHGSKMDEWATL